MFRCNCFSWSKISDFSCSEPYPFSLPSPLPQWPEGNGFATGKICVGELELMQITKFDHIWSCKLLNEKGKGASFYKPIGIPHGFHSLGYYGQPSDQPLHGFVLVARETIPDDKSELCHCNQTRMNATALDKPIDYVLVWSSNDMGEDGSDGCGYFWFPCAPEGYKTMGYVVTDKPGKPSLDEVRCVRADLTETCEAHLLILDADSLSPQIPFHVWTTRPCHRGMYAKGLSTGTFFCCTYKNSKDELDISCLKNLDPTLHAMPNLDQIHALIHHYGPTVFFHPHDVYLPSSVPWFFKNGAKLCKKGSTVAESIDSKGSILPEGGKNDGNYWIELPEGDENSYVKYGNIESSELYVHIKPALGGTFTDIVMWVFYPFNGPATLKIGLVDIAFNKIGQHVGDWEHFTLRINNFKGELRSIYFSQHSSGEWVDASKLEFVQSNKAAVYSSKNGHASFAHPGNYLQGSQRLGIGIRNDAERSDFYIDSSNKYQIVAAEYLKEKVEEPCWLQYMREWGPTIVYNSREEVEKIISFLPYLVRFSVENIFNKFPTELSGEEGPTGPKEKNNWEGDERD